MTRLLFVPGFTADTFNTIQRRYVALTQHLRGRLELVWCLPPDDPDEWLWANPQRRDRRPPILDALAAIDATLIRRRIHRGSAWGRVRDFRRLIETETFAGVYAVFAHRFPPLYAGRRAGVVTIWDAAWNSLEPPHRFPRAKAVFYRRVIDRFVAATPMIAESLEAHGISKEKTFVRWSGIDTATVQQLDATTARRDVCSELRIGADERMVLQLTSFLPSKNTVMAVRVAEILRQRNRSVHWLLAGEDGPDTPAVKAAIRDRGLGDCMHLLGHRDDIWRLMAATDVVALTSNQDGLPNALLEGMAARRPVVSTRAHGPEYIVTDGENGYLVECDDDAAFAQRLLTVLDDASLANTMGLRGRERIERDFSLERWCLRLGDFLVGCVDGPRKVAQKAAKLDRVVHVSS